MPAHSSGAAAGEIELVRQPQHEVLVDHDAVRNSRRRCCRAGALLRAVVGARRSRSRSIAPGLPGSCGQVRQESTMQPTPARSPALNFVTSRADADDAADDFVAGHAGIERCRPIRRAPCAGRNGRRRRRGSRSGRRRPGLAALEAEGRERSGRVLGGVAESFDHGNILRIVGRPDDAVTRRGAAGL